MSILFAFQGVPEEFLNSLSPQEFLMAMERFTKRRGITARQEDHPLPFRWEDFIPSPSEVNFRVPKSFVLSGPSTL